MPAVAGKHAPGGGEGVEGSKGWLGEIITAVSCCRGCKGQRQWQVVEKMRHTCSGKGKRYAQSMRVEYTEPLATCIFPMLGRTGHMRYIGGMHVLIRVSFVYQKNNRGR